MTWEERGGPPIKGPQIGKDLAGTLHERSWQISSAVVFQMNGTPTA